MKKVYQHKISKGTIDEEQWKATNKVLSDGVEQGWGGKGIKVTYGPDWAFNQNLFHNIGVFSTFKTHAQTDELINQLMNKDGTLKTFSQFKNDVAGIVKNYNESWLQAEYNLAVSSTLNAKKWREFEKDKDIYPNLKYTTQHDGRVRPDHKMLDGIIQPVDSKFWNTYYPPNGWNCRCFCEQTDDEPTNDHTEFIPEKIFQNNVGKDDVIFPPSHPYFHELETAKTKIISQAETMMAKETRDDVREWAKEHLVGKFHETKKEMPLPVTITNGDVKSVTGKNHAHRSFRNDLLYVLKGLWHELEYIGNAKDDNKHPGTHEWYYYKWKAAEKVFYFNFRLVDNELHKIEKKTAQRIGLYAITDKNPKEKKE